MSSSGSDVDGESFELLCGQRHQLFDGSLLVVGQTQSDQFVHLGLGCIGEGEVKRQ